MGQRLEDARESLGRGDLSEADRIAKRVLVEMPHDADARRLLLEILIAQERLDEARVAARKQLEFHPQDVQTRILLARLELNAGSPEAAISVLETEETGDRVARAILAVAYEQAGRSTIAQVLRMSAEQAAPETFYSDRRAYFAEQLMELIRDSQEDAPSLVHVLREGRYGEAPNLLQEWLHRVDEDTASIALADWLLLVDEPGGAEAALGRCRSKKHQSAVENRLGDLAQLRGNLEEARHRYRRAVLLDPRDYNGWFDLVRTEFLAGSRVNAVSVCKQILSSDPPRHIAALAGQFQQELGGETDGRVRPGLTGLVWHERGGALLRIQIQLDQGTPTLLVTGNVGRNMEESARVAHRFLMRKCLPLQKIQVHLHFPGFAVAKDGGSAGLAIAAVLYTGISELMIEERVALTGEIDLNGNVRPVGGIRGKITAAHLKGVERVFYPARNSSDLLGVPLLVRRSMALHPVDHFDQVVEFLSR